MNKEEALLHARLNQYKRLVESTNLFIEEVVNMLSRANKSAYVACSFGKDSSVLLHLVRQYLPNIDVFFVEYDETPYLDNYDEVISKWGAINLIRLKIESEIDDIINEKNIIPNAAKSRGLEAGFVGIRAAESKGRRISLKVCGDFYIGKNGVARICPLANWKLQDIAAYIVTNNIPTLSTYETFGFIERTTTGIADDAYGFRYAQLARLKQLDITKYNMLIAKYPKLKAYV